MAASDDGWPDMEMIHRSVRVMPASTEKRSWSRTCREVVPGEKGGRGRSCRDGGEVASARRGGTQSGEDGGGRRRDMLWRVCWDTG